MLKRPSSAPSSPRKQRAAAAAAQADVDGGDFRWPGSPPKPALHSSPPMSHLSPPPSKLVGETKKNLACNAEAGWQAGERWKAGPASTAGEELPAEEAEVKPKVNDPGDAGGGIAEETAEDDLE